MSASVHGDGGRRGLRIALTLILFHDLYGIVANMFLIPAPDTALPWWPGWLVTMRTMVWPVVALLVIMAVGLVGFARGRREQLWFGLVVLVSEALLVESMNAHVGDHRRRFYSVGTALAGWLVGLAFARLRKADMGRAERLAEAGAAAGLAATYFNAGMQKIAAGGLLEDYSFQSHILTHHHIDDTSPIGTIAQFVATNQTAATVVALGAVVIQTGSPLFMLSRRTRMIWGTLLISFHLGTQAFLHIIYLPTAVLLVCWSYPWGRLYARLRKREAPKPVPEEDAVDAHSVRWLIAGAIIVAAVGWTVPGAHDLPHAGHPLYRDDAPPPSNAEP